MSCKTPCIASVTRAMNCDPYLAGQVRSPMGAAVALEFEREMLGRWAMRRPVLANATQKAETW